MSWAMCDSLLVSMRVREMPCEGESVTGVRSNTFCALLHTPSHLQHRYQLNRASAFRY